MILSMTGYGKAECTFGQKKINAEIKSLNSKSLDLGTHITALYREKEMEIRQLIASRIERGKVDFNLWVEKEESVCAPQICEEVMASYVTQIKNISETLHIPEPADFWNVAMRLPETIQTAAVENLSEEEWATVSAAIEKAVDRLIEFRKQEGAALMKKFNEKLDNIASLLAAIEPYEQGRIEKIRQRLKERLSELKGVDYDRGRLEQELIYYIEKFDISEEKQRLANHLRYFRDTMENGHAQGKKLGFIAQEMGREINTTGSKSNQAEMQNIVVKMKDELEQIKEQVLNVM